jgi:hypothetical protein
MKKYGLGILIAMLCAGCGMQQMTTQEVVDRLAECEKAGLHADVYRMFGDGKVVDIQCVPKAGNERRGK